MLRPVILTSILLLLFPKSHGTAPGAKIRISQNGLNYGAQVAVDFLTETVKRLTIPGVSGSAPAGDGDVSYGITDIKIDKFSIPSTSVKIRPGFGLTWSVHNAEIGIKGNWRYGLQVAFLDLGDHGTFEGDTSGISITITFTLGVDRTGHPTIQTQSCDANLNKIRISINGGASWLYDLFIDDIAEPIKESLSALLCLEATNAVNYNAARALATMPIDAVIEKDWSLDYTLVSPPVFTSSYMESTHKGEFHFRGDTKTPPIQPAPLPNAISATDKMVTIYFSDYMLNTAGYVFYKQNILNYHITAKDLPPKDKGYLDADCHTGQICLGNFVPQIRKSYPNASIEIDLLAATWPNATIGLSNNLEGTVQFNVIFKARQPNGKVEYLFTAFAKIDLTSSIKLENMLLKSKITSVKSHVSVKDSAIGKIADGSLNFIFGVATKSFMVPKINEAGKKGFKLPMIQDVTLENTQLTLLPRALELKTDIKYMK